MASMRHFAAIYFILFASLLFCPIVQCDDEDELLQGINSYRQSLDVAALTKHDKANCLAGEIADDIEDEPCPRAGSSGSPPRVAANMQKHLDKCEIDVNTTTDGMVIPVCVPKRVPTLVLTNYTHSQNAKYLNDSKYTGAGIGTEDDWTVLVLTTNTQSGMFANVASGLVCDVVVSSGALLLLLFGVLLV